MIPADLYYLPVLFYRREKSRGAPLLVSEETILIIALTIFPIHLGARFLQIPCSLQFNLL